MIGFDKIIIAFIFEKCYNRVTRWRVLNRMCPVINE